MVGCYVFLWRVLWGHGIIFLEVVRGGFLYIVLGGAGDEKEHPSKNGKQKILREVPKTSSPKWGDDLIFHENSRCFGWNVGCSGRGPLFLKKKTVRFFFPSPPHWARLVSDPWQGAPNGGPQEWKGGPMGGGGLSDIIMKSC